MNAREKTGLGGTGQTQRPAGATERLTVAKYEGLGNDFLVLLDLEGCRPVDGALARVLCDRHRGFGADGLMRAGPPDGDMAMTFELFNADGGGAEMSGNGLRCLAHAAIDAGVVKAGPGDSFGVLTPAGPRQVRVWALEDGWMWSSTEMGTPKVSAESELCNVSNGRALVDVGNPHLVVLGGDPRDLDIAALGPALSLQGPAGGVNVEFVALGPGRDELTMRVWERGVGETLACGTGSVAAAVALRSWGRVSSSVTVHQPGGSVGVEVRPDGVAVLTGPSQRVGLCTTELRVGNPGPPALGGPGGKSEPSEDGGPVGAGGPGD